MQVGRFAATGNALLRASHWFGAQAQTAGSPALSASYMVQQLEERMTGFETAAAASAQALAELKVVHQTFSTSFMQQ